MIMKFFDDYSTIVSQGRYKATHGEGLKILTSRKMLQRSPIALAQVKSGNTSEKLLNKIRQIIRQITTTVYDSIMNSIKV